MIGQYQRLTPPKTTHSPGNGSSRFLSSFKTACDDGVMSKYLTGAAKPDSYNALGASHLRGFSSYPEAVHPLLKSFATEEIITAAVAEFDGLKQLDKENQWAFGVRVRDMARLCGNVFSEDQLIAPFILGTRE